MYDALTQLYPSSFQTVNFLKRKHPEVRRVRVIGSDSLIEQLMRAGFEARHIEEGEVPESSKLLEPQLDAEVSALVVGFDRRLSFSMLCQASYYLQKGVLFFATNPDKYSLVGNFKLPGSGAFLSALQAATGREATVIGKPNPHTLLSILEERQLNPAKCLMIGDNLATDIVFGARARIDTLLVFTGVTTEEAALLSPIKPTHYADHL